MRQIQPMPSFMSKHPTSCWIACANASHVIVLHPNTISHTSAKKIGWIVCISSNAITRVSTYNYIKVIVSRPISLIDIITRNDSIDLISTLIKIGDITKRGLSSGYSTKTRTVRSFSCKYEFNFNIRYNALK